MNLEPATPSPEFMDRRAVLLGAIGALATTAAPVVAAPIAPMTPEMLTFADVCG